MVKHLGTSQCWALLPTPFLSITVCFPLPPPIDLLICKLLNSSGFSEVGIITDKCSSSIRLCLSRYSGKSLMKVSDYLRPL